GQLRAAGSVVARALPALQPRDAQHPGLPAIASDRPRPRRRAPDRLPHELVAVDRDRAWIGDGVVARAEDAHLVRLRGLAEGEIGRAVVLEGAREVDGVAGVEGLRRIERRGRRLAP